MPRQKSEPRKYSPDLTTESPPPSLPPPQDTISTTRNFRHATVYDAAAGRIGLNGFLTPSQLASTTHIPSTPDEVLLRRATAPDTLPHDFYDATPDGSLPESDLLKAIHSYVSDYYAATGAEKDWRSMDETALIAMGVLLEEATREVLGETGDMVLVEPERLEEGLMEGREVGWQVKGRVKRGKSPKDRIREDDEDEDENEDEGGKRKRRRR